MRRGKSEAVLPPLRTLAAYTTQKSFISFDGKGVEMELPFFHPGLPLSGHTFPTRQVCSKFRLSPDFWLVWIRNNRKKVYNHSKAYNGT